jgi:hypothetical protein
MAVIVTGPSSVGKSTFLQSNYLDEFVGKQYTDVIFGYELKRKPIHRHSIIHYNMLHQIRRRYRRLIFMPAARRWSNINQNWDFLTDQNLTRILNSGQIERCIVLVAPVQELIERINSRSISESHTQSKYPSAFWHQATTHLHLSQIYEQLFDILEQHAVPYQVYFSSAQVDGFARTDRVFVEANLEGQFNPPAHRPE